MDSDDEAYILLLLSDGNLPTGTRGSIFRNWRLLSHF